MEAIEAISTRRSIRNFTDLELTDEQIHDLLKIMVAAPSAGNKQPWRIYVVRDTKVKRKLAIGAGDQEFINEAPVVFVVCRVPEESGIRYGNRGRNFYSIQDTAAMTQNLLIAAHAMGLGACWVGAFNDSAVVAAIECPQGILPVAIIPVGYPKVLGSLRGRRPLDSVVTFIPSK
ncbi:MAG: nitroreductase family protein [Candidatus Hodarchaeota archaeon]